MNRRQAKKIGRATRQVISKVGMGSSGSPTLSNLTLRQRPAESIQEEAIELLNLLM